jgi:ASC-1-like (ASCH) protein
MRAKTLWIRDAYLQQILDGRKTVEIRVAYANITRLAAGDRLLLNDAHSFVITRIARYSNFEELLAHEDAAKFAPDVPQKDLLDVLRSVYPPEKEALGVVALELARAAA